MRLITDLYELDIQDASEDVYARVSNLPEISIKTHYEKLDIAASKKVYYLRFTLSDKQIPPPDIRLQELLKEIEKTESI
jgi:hypothetical protein